MKIQVDIPEDLNKKLKFDKINFGMVTLQEMLIENLRRYYSLMDTPMFDKKGNPIVIEE